MSNDYEAVYNAVRTRLNSVNFEDLISRSFDISYEKMRIEQELMFAIAQWGRPSAVYRPRLVKQHNGAWIAIYHGVSGIGATPSEAMDSFDTHWRKQ